MSSAKWPVHIDPTHLYFFTTSAIRRVHLFQRDVIKRILIDCLNNGRILAQYELFAYVIMHNHIHFIVRCCTGHTPITVIREFKKATANLIIRQYEMENNRQVLDFLSSVAPADQQYAVWEAEYEAKNIYSPDFLRQKINYIHHNPLQPHWQLAERAEHYVWSSARHYLTEQRALIPLSDARKLM
jgi:putative transposase